MTKRLRLVFDTETDNLLPNVSVMHLLIIRDIDSDREWVFRNKSIESQLQALSLRPDLELAPFVGWIEDGIKMLNEASLIVGHNIIDYDIVVIEKLYPGLFEPTGVIRDTLVLCRLIFSNVKEDIDYAMLRKGTLPGKLLGSHGLKAWGYRLGEFKGDFPSTDIDVWSVWTVEMEVYGQQDVVVGKKLYLHVQRQIERFNYSQEAIRLEHQFADLLAKIEQNGFPFNVAAAEVLYSELLERKKLVEDALLAQFRPWWKAKWQKDANDKPKRWKDAEITVPGKTLNYKDPLKASRTKDAPFCAITYETFNPGSRDQIADRLQRGWGWVPKEFTETGKPRVSEDILRDLVGELDEEEDGVEETEDELYDKLVKTVPQAKNLADYFLVQKRIGQLAEGKNGWLKLVRNGKVHGSINGLGAVTRRVTHARPNMSQCPRITSPYGLEMRALWHCDPNGPVPYDGPLGEWIQFGVDLSGIEIRCFADVLAEYDNGAYADIVINGDVHTENMKAFGLDDRDKSKTTLYAILYGAGEEKIGSIVGKGSDAGRKIKKGFSAKVPAYKKVVNGLHRQVDRNGWIPALDGGRLHVRSPHKALNTSLQSAGALVAKKWSIGINEGLLDLGWNHGWDGDYAMLGFFHDEVGVALHSPSMKGKIHVDPSDYSNITDKKKLKAAKAKHLQDWYWENSPEVRAIGSLAKQVIKDVEKHFEFRCDLDCEFKVGRNWADCH